MRAGGRDRAKSAGKGCGRVGPEDSARPGNRHHPEPNKINFPFFPKVVYYQCNQEEGFTESCAKAGVASMSIREYLRNRNVPFVALLHRPTVSAARLAQSIHVTGSRVAKGVLFQTDSGYVLTVVPATHRVDPERLGEVLGVSGVALASEGDVSRIFGDCERGAIPPFGRLYGLTTVMDTQLASIRELVMGGNTRHEGIRLRGRDYLMMENPLVARISQVIHPPRKRLTCRAG